MRILITGGTGYIGRVLCKSLTARGDDVVVYSRKADRVPALCGPSVVGISALGEIENETFDAVINLAGEPIAGWLWTASRKQVLRDSRIALTKQLCEHLRQSATPPPTFISGSATGFYGDGGDTVLDETADANIEFTHELCADWEAAADAAESWGARVVKLRTSLVMGSGGGFLGPLTLPFKLCLGGRLGNGTQWMSWISLNDMVRVILFCLDNSECRGPVNACAPNPVTNAEFTSAFARALGRPTFIPAPAFALKLVLGEMSRLLLTGQRAVPEKLTALGFEFEQERLDSALALATGD